MIIHGLQKLTLLDFPGRVAATVFTGGCNFRCPFCHNASLVTKVDPKDVMSDNDFFDFLKTRKGILDGVAITGGEPTLMKDLPEFIQKIHDLGFAVKLDTNGTNPEMLREIVSSGAVEYVAIDIKNDLENYAETIGLPDFLWAKKQDALLESMQILREAKISGKIDFEFRTTIISAFHKQENMERLGKWLSEYAAGGPETHPIKLNYFLQCFKDSGDLISPEMTGVSPETMEEYASIVRKYLPDTRLRGM